MTEVLDVITRLSYIAEDEGVKRSSDLILKQTAAIEKLMLERVALGNKQQQIAANDIAAQQKVLREIKKVDDAIRSKTRTVINERLANSDLNKELQKEVGLLANIGLKMDALKTKKAMAQTAGEVRQVNREIAKLETELAGLSAKAGTGGLLGQILMGIGVGGGLGVVTSLFGFIRGEYNAANQEFEDAKKTAADLQRALKVVGAQRYFDGLIQEADVLAKRYFNLFDNDDIIKAQTALVQYGKLSREELSKVTPVVLELAAAEQIDLVQATERVVDILSGRGRQTLKDYGLSVKGLETEHDRLNIVLGEFQTKITGAAEAYAQTADGIKRANDVLAANLEERLGQYTSKLNILFKQTLLGFFQFIDDMTTSSEEARTKNIQSMASENATWLKSLNEKEFNDQLRLTKLNAMELNRIKDNIANLELSKKYQKGSMDFDTRDENNRINEAVKNERERFDKILAKNGEVYREYYRRKNKKLADLDKKPINPNADLDEAKVPKEKKTVDLAKKEADDTEALYQNLSKVIEEFHLQNQYYTEQANAAGELTDRQYKEETLKNDILYYEEKIMLQEQFGKSSLRERTDLLKKITAAEKEEADRLYKIRLDAFNSEEQFNRDQYAETQKHFERMKQLREKLEDQDAAEQKARVDKSFKDADDKLQAITERNEKIKKSFSSINDIIQSVGDAMNQITQIQIDNIDREISAQQGRIDRAKKYAERGGAELLEIEEERLAQMNEKREKFAKRQLVINNALALSNAIVAVATAAAETGVGAIVAIPAVLGAIAAGYALVTSLTEPQYFSEGEKFVDGPGTSKSDSIPAMLSKGERVVDAHRSSKFKPLLDDIQDDRFKDQGDLIRQISTGIYGSPMDYKGILESKNTSSTALDTRLLVDINKTLQGVQEAIEEQPVPYMTADENGLNIFFSKMQKRKQKQSKY